MSREEAIAILKNEKPCNDKTLKYSDDVLILALDMAIEALKQKPIDKSKMMYEIYMEGVNMSGEYQGCWVRFKDIEYVVDRYIGDKV